MVATEHSFPVHIKRAKESSETLRNSSLLLLLRRCSHEHIMDALGGRFKYLAFSVPCHESENVFERLGNDKYSEEAVRINHHLGLHSFGEQFFISSCCRSQ